MGIFDKKQTVEVNKNDALKCTIQVALENNCTLTVELPNKTTASDFRAKLKYIIDHLDIVDKRNLALAKRRKEIFNGISDVTKDSSPMVTDVKPPVLSSKELTQVRPKAKRLTREQIIQCLKSGEIITTKTLCQRLNLTRTNKAKNKLSIWLFRLNRQGIITRLPNGAGNLGDYMVK